jgi:rhodanese-related sulfurtransferase
MGLAIAAVVCGAILLGLIALRIARKRARGAMQEHTITADALRQLMSARQNVLLFDVRQPLDLLTDLEIIPGANRVPPKELIGNPSLIPRDKDIVFYCTCPGDKTARSVLHQARALNFSRVKLLEGGLAAWKAKGYPVEPYRESFHLDTAK